MASNSNLRPHRAFPWRDNRAYYEHLTEDVIRWFYDEYLMGGRSLKVLIIASPESASRILKFACDWERQFDAGYFCPIKPIFVFSEELDTVEGASEVKALSRLHRYSLPFEDAAAERWNPKAEIVKAQMRQLRSTMTRMRKRNSFLELPELSFLNPNSTAARREIRIAADRRIADRRAPFDMILSGPYGRWIGRWLRLGAGEIAKSYNDDGRQRYRLRKVTLPNVNAPFLTHCFGWGAHPFGSTGGAFDFAQYGGSQAFRRLVDTRRTHARIALMGLGPQMMDDPRLVSMSTPSESMEINYGSGKRTNEDIHRQCYEAVEFYYDMIEQWMFGDADDPRRSDHLGDVIARHVVSMYHAWKDSPKGKVKRCIPRRVPRRDRA